MKTMSVGEFKTHFSEALKSAEAGEKIAITFGKKKEIKAYLVPSITTKNIQRKIGILNGTSGYFMANDFNITTDEEFPI
jgi:antitoxin (DNA-binding transcriptional repressor) of toxin-antitoxin stability system